MTFDVARRRGPWLGWNREEIGAGGSFAAPRNPVFSGIG
jgi:hypothetical protein